MKPQPITETPRTPKGKHMGQRAGYYMPVKVCATCGETTKASYHPMCRRINGKLLVVNK